MQRASLLALLVLGLLSPLCVADEPRPAATSTPAAKATKPPQPVVMRTDRLLKLAVYIENLEPGRLDMAAWSRNETDDPSDTSASFCAGGHAAGLFASENFRLQKPPTGHGTVVPVYGDKRELEACQAFFGLSPTEAYELFGSPGMYADTRVVNDPRHVAGMLRKMAAKGQARAAVKLASVASVR